MKLTVERIVEAGLAVFADTGYHGLSMRQVADRLDAQAGSLYHHVASKGELLQLMADRLAGQAYDAGAAAIEALPADAGWPARIEAQVVALRQVLSRNPGGAMLFAGSPKVLSAGALSLMERMLTTLAEAGVPQEHRGVAADTLFSHAAGYVLQEQIEAPAGPVTQEGAEALTERFPMTFAAASEHDDDEQFVRSVRLICRGVAALAE